LATRIPVEAPYEQIPHICEVMRRQADDLLRKVSRPPDALSMQGSTLYVSRLLNTTRQFLEFYEHQVRPFLAAQFDRKSPLANPLKAAATFDKLAELAGAGDLSEFVEQIRALCEE